MRADILWFKLFALFNVGNCRATLVQHFTALAGGRLVQIAHGHIANQRERRFVSECRLHARVENVVLYRKF